MERDLLQIKNFHEYQLYIFDLDNTLINEFDYLSTAYDEIGKQFNNPAISFFLKKTFLNEGRQFLFNKMATHFGLVESSIALAIEILRNIELKNKLTIPPDLINLLHQLKAQNKHLTILSNGNPVQQKNKMKNLAIQASEYFSLIVYANEITPKPSPAGVDFILGKTNIEKCNTIMIGDSNVDEQSAHNAGVDFIFSQHLPLIS